ncbi:MAG: DUF1194 domain-containing protein [Alphaproteobacteria bacterium]|nr:DUF1194 domain-containing protein [Alphaproteobacteria bacterium]
MISRSGIALAVLAPIILWLVSPSLAAQRVDQELVLAVDTSSSVSYREYRFQMEGYAAAFRNQTLIDTIFEAAPDGVAVALVHWSGAREQRVAVEWTRVHDAASALGFAERIALTRRTFLTGQTDIAAAIRYATRLFPNNPFDGPRWTIDISGDGRSNQGEHPVAARDEAVSSGIVINGLPILSDVKLLDRYYLDNVIGGTGSFALTADRFEDFEVAVLKKLINEIAGNAIADSGPPPYSAESTPAMKLTRLSPSDRLR